MTTRRAKDLVAEANREVETLSGEEAVKLVGDPNVVLRGRPGRRGAAEDREAAGSGACAPRFPGVPGRPEQPDPQAGARRWQEAGALLRLRATARLWGRRALKEMGITNVAHVAGGFPALQQAGGPQEGVGR